MTRLELLSLLDQLERSEAALLTWGYVDSGFTEDEVKSKVQDLLGLDEFEAEESHRGVARTRVARQDPAGAACPVPYPFGGNDPPDGTTAPTVPAAPHERVVALRTLPRL